MIDIDRLINSLQKNDFLKSFFYEKTLSSTNDYISANEIAVDSLVITDEQTAGKGRAGKKWLSEKNTSLTFSIKKKFNISPAENQNIIRFFSYCVHSALKELIDGSNINNSDGLIIKWPNDILFNGKKLCGILVESKLPSDIYITGIGINCNQKYFQAELNAISLSEIIGNEIDITGLLINILDKFNSLKELLHPEKSAILFEKWKMQAKIIGKYCDFTRPDGKINNGKIIDLNYDGSITVKINDKPEIFNAGELSLTGID